MMINANVWHCIMNELSNIKAVLPCSSFSIPKKDSPFRLRRRVMVYFSATA
jgi:hypothetical protein